MLGRFAKTHQTSFVSVETCIPKRGPGVDLAWTWLPWKETHETTRHANVSIHVLRLGLLISWQAKVFLPSCTRQQSGKV